MKKLLITFSALILSASTILTGCGSAKMTKNATDSYFDNGYAYSKESSDADYFGFGDFKVMQSTGSSFVVEDSASESVSEQESIETPAGRKIIYKSSFNIQTTAFDIAIAELNNLCEKYGAYYENSEIYGTKENANRNGSFTVRVPVQSYNAFKQETGSIGVVTRSSENNRDVTEVYVDTEARLQSAKVREERLLEILANADSLDDVLLLEKELADVRYEIESMSGSLRKYDSLISYSTIDINISEEIEPVEIKPIPKTFGQKVHSSLTEGFEDFSREIGYLFLDILYNLPGIIIFVVTIVIICAIIRSVIRKSKKKKEKVIEKNDSESTDVKEKS